MAKCPVCGNEYTGRCKNCSPDSENKKPGRSGVGKNRKNAGNDGTVLLTTVSDNFEASLIETRLKQVGIPVMLKYRETGAYLSFFMGKTSFGVDIFVPAESAEEAKQWITPPQAEEGEPSEEQPGESIDSAREDYRKRIEFRSTLTFVVILAAILVILILSFVFKH